MIRYLEQQRTFARFTLILVKPDTALRQEFNLNLVLLQENMVLGDFQSILNLRAGLLRAVYAENQNASTAAVCLGYIFGSYLDIGVCVVVTTLGIVLGLPFGYRPKISLIPAHNLPIELLYALLIIHHNPYLPIFVNDLVEKSP